MRRIPPVSVLSLVLLLTLSVTGVRLAAAPPGAAPGATLLLPYFEVDLKGFRGPTTLFSINNAGDEAVVAHVVLWSDRAVPTYSFDVALGSDDVQTVNLRDLFLGGSVPTTKGQGLDACSDPVASPALDPVALRRRHTGRPDPEDGLCYGFGPLGPDRATGYVTVDVVRRCSGEQLAFPGDSNYFPSFEIGTPDPFSFLAAYDNVLWGDAIYVADQDDSAQGIELVQLPSLEEEEPRATFYRRYTDGTDRRAMLSNRYRGRYLVGGAFDGGTELLVWLESQWPADPGICGAPLAIDCHLTDLTLYDEEAQGGERRDLPLESLVFRLPIGGADAPAPAPAGVFELENAYYGGCYQIPTGPIPAQAWVGSVIRAEGRYSVGLSATALPFRTR